MRKYFLYLCLLLINIASSNCKKSHADVNLSDTTAIDTTTPDTPGSVYIPVPVDSLIGIFVGNTRKIYIDYYPYIGTSTTDTTYYIDTIQVYKLNSDSFQLGGRWRSFGQWSSSVFKYNSTNKYKDGITSSRSDNSIILNFMAFNDSLEAEAIQHLIFGNHIITTYTFSGRKHSK